MQEVLEGLKLPDSAAWIRELEFEAWVIWDEGADLELTASSLQGYLTLFVVDD